MSKLTYTIDPGKEERYKTLSSSELKRYRKDFKSTKADKALIDKILSERRSIWQK